ncbi:MAG: hypothetical protein ACOCQG_00615 [Candidatus Nanoarchaeia archaeon]
MVIPSSYAININPQQYTIEEPKLGENYNIIITIINSEVNTHNINTRVAEKSSHLEPYLDMEKDSVELGPNERQNLGFSFKIPENITPQKHELVIDFLTVGQKEESFTLNFEIQGEKKREINFKDVSVNAKDSESPIYFTLETENKGNLIENIQPIVEISKNKETIKTIDGSGAFRIMPQEKSNLSLMLDPAQLKEGGTYDFTSYLKYNNQTSQKIKGSFNLDIIQRDGEKRLKRINHGEKLSIPANVQRTTDDFSFYKIKTQIKEKNITNTIEGSFDEKNKIIDIELETNELSAGEYKVELEIAEGHQLENVRKEEYTLKVREGLLERTLPYLFVLAIILFAFGAYLYGPPLFIREYLLSKKINKVNKRFNGIEKDMRKLNKELNEFVTNSNEWLARYGKGFK